MKKSATYIKGIRTLVYFIVLLILIGVVCDVIIVEYVDSIRIRNILFLFLQAILFVLVIKLIRSPKLADPRVTLLDILCMAMLMVSIVGAYTHMQQEGSIIAEITDSFQGNNGYSGSYSNGTGDKGYYDIEKALENAIKKSNFKKLEDVYRIQVGERIFIYFKEDEKNIVEFAFLKEDDLYYSLGSMCVYVLFDDSYTAEETIRQDIVHTMMRSKWDEIQLEAPAWGVSTDENISSMTINAEPVDDVILINEKDGKKYYFWVITNVGEIKTLDDVRAVEIEMNGL